MTRDGVSLLFELESVFFQDRMDDREGSFSETMESEQILFSVGT